MTVEERFAAKVDRSGDCWLWTGARRLPERRYGLFHWNGPKAAHRVAWQLAHGPIPDGMLVCHSCDNPPCVNPAHLFLGTNADNAADRVAKGRSARTSGEAHPQARLTALQVDAIRASHRAGSSLRALARQHAISPTHVQRLVRGEQWTA